MPWVGEKDPYRIWVSEIILQQTRVEQGLSYYNRFVEAFPNVESLARAEDAHVFKLWEGLGYYSRARNMLFTARLIMERFNGQFPQTYAEIVSLKGIGPYTAAAIASFAFNLPHAVVDGNVERILSRIWGVSIPVDSTDGKKEIRALSDTLLDTHQPAAFNQAIMDFGALQCVPRKPNCTMCPFSSNCIAFQQNQVETLPLKLPKQKKTARYFHYLVFQYAGDTWIRQRPAGDIWAGLYEFPLIESDSPELNYSDFQDSALVRTHVLPSEQVTLHPSKIYRQTLSHQHIHARFWIIALQNPLISTESGYLQRVPRTSLHTFAFPRVLRWYLDEKEVPLSLF